MINCLAAFKSLLGILSLASIYACNSPIDYPDPVVERPPLIGTPIIASTSFSLSRVGYQQKEFFYSGEAHSYSNLSPLGSDGEWIVTPADSANYKTRMLVYRPINPAKFNGTVIVEWLNVTAGVDTAAEWMMQHTELIRRGYAWVGVSAQYVGVEGGDTALPSPVPISLALKKFAPLRYHSLSHPGDSFSYDIFAQAAQAVRHPTGISPLDNLPIRKVIAAGESQSATRLMTFVDAFGTRTDLFDGYFIHSRLGILPEANGSLAPLSEAPQAEIPVPALAKVRADIDKPVMNVQTETDLFVASAFGSRQPDSTNYRLWEMAGTAHADYYTITGSMQDKGNDPATAEVVVTDQPNTLLPACPEPVNGAPQHHFIAEAAMHALHDWLADGTAPPSSPRFEINAAGDGFKRDSYGNVLGGVRSPYVDVPTALLSGENSSTREDGICFLLGTTQMLDDATLRSLYPDHAAYVVAVSDAVRDEIAKGFLLPEDGALIIQAAQNSDIPPSQ